MQRKFLITYDLKKPGQNYPKLFEQIKRLGNAFHCMQNTWLLKSDMSSMEILRHLENQVDGGDSVFVVQIADWASLNVANAEWLNS